MAKNNLPNRPNQGRPVVTAVSQQYAGPFPHEQMLQSYENTLPGAADRLLRYTEKNQEHRHEVEKQYLKAEHQRHLLGQVMAFVVVMVVLAIGAYLVANDKKTEGFVLILVEVVGLAGLFMYNEHQKRKFDKENTE